MGENTKAFMILLEDLENRLVTKEYFSLRMDQVQTTLDKLLTVINRLETESIAGLAQDKRREKQIENYEKRIQKLETSWSS